MKEMENNDFIHTLDAVYNLCSEIKERITSVETPNEEESNEGVILLSDNLQRLQAEIVELKLGLSSDREGRDKLRAAINLRFKEINEVYSALSTTNERIFAGQERISEELQRIQMYGGISGNQLDTLEVIFHRDRDKTVIKNIRNDVEDFEYRTRIRAEKLEKARLLQQEAEELKP